MSALFFFLFLSFSGEEIKIGGFGTFEACESYRARVVKREGSTTRECEREMVTRYSLLVNGSEIGRRTNNQ